MKKNVIIVGSLGLLGFNLVLDLLKDDYKVIGLDIIKDKKKLNFLGNNKNFFFLKADISSVKQINNSIRAGEKKFGKIYGAINCSYPILCGSNVSPNKANPKNIIYNLTKHLGGAILFATQICKYFNSNKNGNLINISSIQGLGAPKFQHYNNQIFFSPIEYSAIKAGIISITKYLSKYYLKSGLKINCISPGGIRTKAQNNKFVNAYIRDCGKIGLLYPSHITSTVRYLLSDDSSAINGQNIIIDDGWSL
jgi:NAD(P)-dependent dehydrogenase (short-subunit alcohol dehydrogenase family)